MTEQEKADNFIEDVRWYFGQVEDDWIMEQPEYSYFDCYQTSAPFQALSADMQHWVILLVEELFEDHKEVMRAKKAAQQPITDWRLESQPD